MHSLPRQLPQQNHAMHVAACGPGMIAITLVHHVTYPHTPRPPGHMQQHTRSRRCTSEALVPTQFLWTISTLTPLKNNLCANPSPPQAAPTGSQNHYSRAHIKALHQPGDTRVKYNTIKQLYETGRDSPAVLLPWDGCIKGKACNKARHRCWYPCQIHHGIEPWSLSKGQAMPHQPCSKAFHPAKSNPRQKQSTPDLQ